MAYLKKILLTLIIVFSSLLFFRMITIGLAISKLSNSNSNGIPLVEDRAVGQGALSINHRIFEWLDFVMYDYEVVSLLANAEKTNLRCYAVWALARRGKKEEVLKITKKEQTKQQKVDYNGPCTGWTGNAAVFMRKMITSKAYGFQSDIRLTESEYEQIKVSDIPYSKVVEQKVHLRGKACCSDSYSLMIGFLSVF